MIRRRFQRGQHLRDEPGRQLPGLLRRRTKTAWGGGIGSGRAFADQQLIKNVYICPSIGDEDSLRNGRTDIGPKLREIAMRGWRRTARRTRSSVVSKPDLVCGPLRWDQAAAEGYSHERGDLRSPRRRLRASPGRRPTIPVELPEGGGRHLRLGKRRTVVAGGPSAARRMLG
jgi:hypothetical protein